MARRSSKKVQDRKGHKTARDRLAAVAADLFYRKGIHAVGIEEIVKEAGVAKISLYRSFASKDDLIAAYLEDLRVRFWRTWDEKFARFDGNPRAQLNAIMKYLADWTTRPGYRGCPFINYCAEFPDASHPGRKVSDDTMREMRQRFLRIAESLGVARPRQLADSLLLLVEGAYAISQTLSDPDGPGRALIWAARALTDSQLSASGSSSTR